MNRITLDAITRQARTARAEARLEGLEEPHPQLAHFNLFDKHATLRG